MAKVNPQDLKLYPHMYHNDIKIWKRFIAKFGKDYQRFEYDVKVGSGTGDIRGRRDAFSRMQQILSLYRIDVLALRSENIEIIEVKPRATAGAIGQVLTYRELFIRDNQPTQPVIPTIVTDYEMPDIRYLTNRLSIRYIVI